MPIQAKPYRLKNTIQHYAWGTRGSEAFIPRLLGIAPEPDTPYAELWLGAHPKAPSMVEIDSELYIPLDQWISEFPEEILGPWIAGQFGNKLPFLTKVLSAGQSLSIQAHPNKSEAEILHAQDPDHYADDNHKPEIAVALDELTALMGFKPYDEILETFNRYPELADFLGAPLITHLWDAADLDLETQRMRSLLAFAVLIKRSLVDPNILIDAVDELAFRLLISSVDEVETRFLDLYQKYGSGDVGLFAFLLFNLVHLAPGEALYTPAGVPHAYLCGNIIECMANSDNVVRVGLTPKFRDAETLLEIVDTTPQHPRIMEANPDEQETVYTTLAREFELSLWSLDEGQCIKIEKRQGPAILIITQGQAQLVWADDKMLLARGQSVLIPHILDGYSLSAVGGEAQIFRTTVPEI